MGASTRGHVNSSSAVPHSGTVTNASDAPNAASSADSSVSIRIRARLLALRGDTARAVTSLQLAVDRGWRRAWWLRRDPALEGVRRDAAFIATLQKIDAQLAVQRKNVSA